jgi:CubicO group peptidase (beta-lactamase class C family)
MNTIALLVVILLTTLFVARASAEPPKQQPTSLVFPASDWQQSTPEAQNFNPEKLAAALKNLPGDVLVSRNGYAIASKGDITRPRSVLSVSKSVTALIAGTLLQQKKLQLDDPVHGSDKPTTPAATYRHFLSMTSDFGLTPHEPGKHFAYNNEAIDFYGKSMAEKFFPNKKPDEILQTALWDTIGRQDTVQFNGQWGGWGGGWSVSARDLARIGLLVLNEGKWKDIQLIPADFIRELYKDQIPKDATISISFGEGGKGAGQDTSYHQLKASQGMKGNYSFGWWTNASRLYPDLPADMIWASGKFGNFIIVCPSLQLVIGVTNQIDPNPDAALYARAVLSAVPGSKISEPPPWRKTKVDIRGEDFLINGEPTLKGKTWRGHNIEGLLPNSRMVQGIYDDLNPETKKLWAYPDGKPFDADRNTDEFLAAMPSWREHGLLAFTINLQGGSPQGYSKDQPWINSAFNPDGSFAGGYTLGLQKIINKADELGMVVILGYFYFGQEPRMNGEDAIKAATKNATNWVVDKGFTNVIIEIANEADISKYKHPIIKPENTKPLLDLVKDLSKNKVNNKIGRLYVSTSLKGNALPTADLVKEVDYVLIHGNGVGKPARIEEMVDAVRNLDTWKSAPKPIVFNEDDHFDFDKPENNFLAATKKHASWGYFDYRMKNEKFEDGYQSVPVDWTINSPRKKAFFNTLKEMTKQNPAKQSP